MEPQRVSVCPATPRRRYWIAWVGWSARLPKGPSEVAWFQNPTTLLESEDSPWVIADGDLTVRRTSDDTPFTTEA